MRAIILAAGKGTRMRELTAAVPKPMLKVRGKPILEHIILGMAAAGIREFCVITGYRAEVIESYFQDGRPWSLQIRYVRQTVQDGTGKAPELAQDFAGTEPFLLTYGDILVEPLTYLRMRKRFDPKEFSGLITVTPGEDVTKGGINFFDANFCLQRIVEKPTMEQVKKYREDGWLEKGRPVWYNAGIYIFQPSLFQFTAQLQKSPRGEYELPDAINAMVVAGHRIAGLEIQDRWVDVRDPEVLQELEKGTF
jgi:NDP-sugar pyrophosphorylase family protein